MDFIATRVNELLSRVSPIKRWLISDVANEYYRAGWSETSLQKCVKGKRIERVYRNHCGIKLSYNLRKGGLLVSVRTDKLSNLQNLVNCYKNEQNKENSPDKG